VTSRSLPQQGAQIFSPLAGQNRSGRRLAQIAQAGRWGIFFAFAGPVPEKRRKAVSISDGNDLSPQEATKTGRGLERLRPWHLGDTTQNIRHDECYGKLFQRIWI
jgi:hypothetical protein